VRAGQRRPPPLTKVHLATIPLPHGAFHVRGNLSSGCGGTPPAGARPVRRREFALLELPNQRVQGTVEHLRHVPGGDLVAEQRLGVAELVVRALPDRDLEREPLGCHRREPPTRSGGLNLPRNDEDGLPPGRGRVRGGPRGHP